MLTLAELDAFFAAQPTKKPAKPTKTAGKPTPAPRPERYWLPEAVVLWESQWQCACGCSGPDTPQLFVRERCGQALRLRAIRSPNQYGLLPRYREEALPSHITTCPNCFAGASEYVAQQLILPFPEEQTRFKERLTEAVDFAVLVDELASALEHHELPRRVKPRETPLPENWEFIPHDDEWTKTQHSHEVYRVYHHSVGSNFGPEQPYCWKE